MIFAQTIRQPVAYGFVEKDGREATAASDANSIGNTWIARGILMGRDHLPSLKPITDQLRVDNSLVGDQSEAFIVGGGKAAQPQTPSDAKDEGESNVPENHASDRCATSAVFPWMRAYGCLGRKASDEK